MPPTTVNRWCGALFVAAAIATWAGLLFVGRGMTFFHDDWSFIVGVEGFGSVRDWFVPHNEHWSTLLFLVFRSIFALVGLSSYLPYLGVLLLLHVLAAAGVYVLLRRVNGAPVALAGSLLVLLLGSGYQNLFWAFQIGFVGSAAAGIWAIAAFERDGRRALVAGILLLLGALMTSGIGLVFAAAVGAELLFDPARRRRLLWLVPVGAIYLAWYLAFGRANLGIERDPFTLEALADVPSFVWGGVVASVQAAIGTAPGFAGLGIGLAIVLLALPVLRLVGLPIPARSLGALGGLVVMYAIIGLVRGDLSDTQPTRPRYLYEGVILVVLIASGLLGRRLAPERLSLARPATAVLAAGLAILLASGLTHNIVLIRAGRDDWLTRANEARAYLALLDTAPAERIRPPEEVPWVIPDPPTMRALIARYGSPARDALVPSVVPRPRPADRDRALFRYLGGDFRPVSATSAAPDGPLTVTGLAGGTLTPVADGCLVLHPQQRTETLIVELPDGQALDVTTTDAGALRAYLGREAPPQAATRIDVAVGAEQTTRLAMPTHGDGEPWLVRLVVPGAAGETTVCPVQP